MDATEPYVGGNVGTTQFSDYPSGSTYRSSSITRENMKTAVIEHPAQSVSPRSISMRSITMRTEQTFDEFADHVYRVNKRELRHRNGTLIELQPDLAYSLLMLGMKRLLTEEEFGIVCERFMAEIKALEDQGILPRDSVTVVATPFDVPNRPAIPERFAEEIDDEATIKTYLTGEVSFTIAKIYPDLQQREIEVEVGFSERETEGL
jgi:hypothetical protein